MTSEPWTTLETLAVTLLDVVCDVPHLISTEATDVLGQDGQQDTTLVERIRLRSLNEQQMQALVAIQRNEQVTNSDMQQVFQSA